ncbi:sirohydrochlorin ferrochelatase [Nonomuraea soli]|uniref:Sirohydrochlorin ferrochelatase n=1 Tax=Nonomuraea soli TaxID=1032476 RepID=A0A7W0CNZ8_9ACTN|nr:sirohydrochlorin chelatase [Nonomuraea soli]MBA2894554.1 sirohydrochlorin ferrochelatase [Nonomuraea soli]
MAVAHGSRDPRAARTVESLLDAVRQARPGLVVRSAYLDHAGPRLPEALAGLDEAVVLPLLLTEAYHSRVDLPAAIAEVRAARGGPTVHYGTTLGPHPLMTAALERRLAEAGVARDRDTAVVLVSAGSSSAEANAVIGAMARSWHGWWGVTAAYASAADPTPAQAVALLKRAGAPRIVVAPYLLAPGYFADKVRHSTLEAGADAVADVLGPAPELVEVLLARYRQAIRRSERVPV